MPLNLSVAQWMRRNCRFAAFSYQDPEFAGGDFYDYPKDPIKQMADFYAITYMRGELGNNRKDMTGYDEEFTKSLDYAYKDVLSSMKADYLKKLAQSISQELKHVFDATFDSHHWKLQETTKMMAGVRAAMDALVKSPAEGAAKAKEFFTKLKWDTNFGGEAWAAICDGTINLAEAASPAEVTSALDHVVDMEHNTGQVFKNKVTGYGNPDIKRFMDFKAESKDIRGLESVVSPVVKNMLEHFTRRERPYDPKDVFERRKKDIIGYPLPEGQPPDPRMYWAALKYCQNVLRGRWPEAEPYIAKNTDAAYEYAMTVVKGRWPEGEPAILKSNHTSCNYAADVIKGRWPEAEPEIAKSPILASAYAIDVVKGRWPEGEAAILKGQSAEIYRYAASAIKGRWPEGEPAIAKDHDMAIRYAINVVKGRWPEGEPAISRDARASRRYAAEVVHGRWAPGEETIAKSSNSDPYTAFAYARDIVKGRWPEGEPMISRDSDCWTSYQDMIGAEAPLENKPEGEKTASWLRRFLSFS